MECAAKRWYNHSANEDKQMHFVLAIYGRKLPAITGRMISGMNRA
jgi:hypothetical protein